MIIDPITVEPDQKVRDALEVMRRHGISGLPVTKGGKLVGILTNRDLRFERRLDIPVSEVMTKREKLITVKEGIGIEELKRRIARGEGLYLLTKPEGLRTIETEGLPFQVLLRQDPFLKRRWSIALVLVKGYNNLEEVKGGSRSDQEGSRGHPQGP